MSEEAYIAILKAIREDVRKFRKEFFEQMESIKEDINKFKADVREEVESGKCRCNGVK